MNDTVHVITKQCIGCNERSELRVDAAGYKAWRNGAFIQDALPGLSKDECELLITGTCVTCWETLFGDDE